MGLASVERTSSVQEEMSQDVFGSTMLERFVTEMTQKGILWGREGRMLPLSAALGTTAIFPPRCALLIVPLGPISPVATRMGVKWASVAMLDSAVHGQNLPRVRHALSRTIAFMEYANALQQGQELVLHHK